METGVAAPPNTHTTVVGTSRSQDTEIHFPRSLPEISLVFKTAVKMSDRNLQTAVTIERISDHDLKWWKKSRV
jgi:hypothetical protein